MVFCWSASAAQTADEEELGPIVIDYGQPRDEIAEEVFDKRAHPRVEGALFYHSKSIRPRWSRRKRHVAKIGRHIFYWTFIECDTTE